MHNPQQTVDHFDTIQDSCYLEYCRYHPEQAVEVGRDEVWADVESQKLSVDKEE